MENSAKTVTFPNWARLKRDKGNYPTWRKHVIDHLQASGCEQAISSDFSQLAYDSASDSDSSDEDFEDDFSSFTLGGGRQKHPIPQTSPTSSQEQLEEKYKQEINAFLQGTRKAKQKKHKERKKRKKQKKFEEKKRQMDARARTLIRSTIDAKAFAPSTFHCQTAYDLWTALQPAEGYTEEEVHRALGMAN